MATQYGAGEQATTSSAGAQEPRYRIVVQYKSAEGHSRRGQVCARLAEAEKTWMSASEAYVHQLLGLGHRVPVLVSTEAGSVSPSDLEKAANAEWAMTGPAAKTALIRRIYFGSPR